MARLEYRGPLGRDTTDVTTLPQAQQIIQSASQTKSEMEAEVKSELSGKATTSYVDSLIGNYATPTDLTSAFSDKLSTSVLGQSVAKINNDLTFPTSYFPTVKTRGAQMFQWKGTMTNRTLSGGPVELTRLNVSSSGGGYYMVLAWAIVEAKLDGVGQTPALEITSGSGYRLSYGLGMAGYDKDWSKVDCVPVESRYVYKSSQDLILKAVRGGSGVSTIQFSGFQPTFSALVIPVSYGT